MSYYPAFLDVRGRMCVVIGGAGIAEQKVRALLDAGAAVTVVSEFVTEPLEQLASERRILLRRRPYRRGDLAGAFLAIAANAAGETRVAIWQEAQDERVLLNSVDDVPHCHFIAPAVHRRGDLVIAVSTAGKSPALAVRLRDRIGAGVGPEYGALLDLLGELRPEIAAHEPDFARRTALWYRLIDLDLAEDIRRHGVDAARTRVRAVLAVAEKPVPPSPSVDGAGHGAAGG